VHVERLPCTVCLPSLVLVAQVTFLLEQEHTLCGMAVAACAFAPCWFLAVPTYARDAAIASRGSSSGPVSVCLSLTSCYCIEKPAQSELVLAYGFPATCPTLRFTKIRVPVGLSSLVTFSKICMRPTFSNSTLYYPHSESVSRILFVVECLAIGRSQQNQNYWKV